MPEEIEVPTEHAHESIHEEAEKTGERWILMVALSTALLAVCAAITALLASHHANEALIDQLQASDQWSFYQAKGIKSSVLQSKLELLRSLGKDHAAADDEQLNRYNEEQKQVEEVAREHQKSSEEHLAVHNTLAKGVTAFQIAIAVSAIAALTRKKPLWYGGMLLGVCGLLLMIIGLT